MSAVMEKTNEQPQFFRVTDPQKTVDIYLAVGQEPKNLDRIGEVCEILRELVGEGLIEFHASKRSAA